MTENTVPAILEHSHFVRDYTEPLPYPLLRRILDRRDGIIDGLWDRRTNRSAWADTGEEPENITMWIGQREAAFTEQADHELILLRAVEAQHQARLDALTRSLPHLEDNLAQAQQARDLIDDEPSDVTSRGVAEQDDPENIIVARRTREHHQRVVAPAQARLDAARDRLDAAHQEIADIRSVIDAARDVAVARVRRLKDHCERRAGVYRRAWMRSWQKGSHHSGDERLAPAAIRAPEVIHLPDWVLAHLEERTPATPVSPITEIA